MNPLNVGIIVACAHAGINPAEFSRIEGFHDALQKSASADSFGRLVAGLAHDVMVQAGRAADFETHLFGELAKTANWSEVHFETVAPVYRALSTVVGELEKRAGEGFNPLAIGMEGGKMMVGGAAVAGSALGGLHWMLNRHATEDDAKSESLQARTDYYRRLAQEISQELRNSPPPALRRAVKQRSETVL